MPDFSKLLSFSATGMQAQAMRLQTVSENIANADTPGYRRKIISFGNMLSAGEGLAGTKGIDVSLDAKAGSEIYDPGHPLADTNGYYTGSNVNLIIELADAREAQRSYEANLRVFDQTRKMSKSLLELLRR